MMCAWQELLSILPPGLRREVDSLGKEEAQELRLRLDAPPELVLTRGSQWLGGQTRGEDLHFVVNAASRYSPWSAETAAQGFLTAPGGHRVGLCGQAVIRNGHMEGIREVSSLCIRIARDFPGIGTAAAREQGSILILGPPGWGKTTLLRDLVRQLSQREHVAVVDEREEVFPRGISRGGRLDVLSGCPKAEGILMTLRAMGPSCIAVDEITLESDCQALIRAAYCGVRLIATAHGASPEDLRSRGVYRPLVAEGIFQKALVLRRDKTYTVERMTI